MVLYHEYPDSVVASYVERVRELSTQIPGHPAVAALDALAVRPFSMRAPANSGVRLVSDVGAWFTVRSSMLTCREPVARAAYQRLWQDLDAAGWSSRSKQYVAWGLSALRMRSIEGVEARQLYESTMAELIPAQELGWT